MNPKDFDKDKIKAQRSQFAAIASFLPKPRLLVPDRVREILPWTKGDVRAITIGQSYDSAVTLTLDNEFKLNREKTLLMERALSVGTLRMNKNQKSSLSKRKDEVFSAGEKFSIIENTLSMPGAGMIRKFNV